MQPLDVSQTPIDFLAADGHKWLLGPEGAGFKIGGEAVKCKSCHEKGDGTGTTANTYKEFKAFLAAAGAK